MHYQYVVILKRESERTTDVLSFLLCLLSSILFLYSAAAPVLGSGNASGQSYFLGGIAVVLLAGVLFNLANRRAGRARIRYRYLLLLATLGWLAMPVLPWLAGLFVVLAFLEYQTKRPLEIGFDSDRVVINTLIRRQYDWSDFSNIVLRDGLLTMDFKNNRLLQKEVVDEEEDDDDAEEKEFNDYCQARLQEAALK
jgi:nitrate reductase gamma subunit